MDCPGCKQPMHDMVSESGTQYRGCKACQWVWLGTTHDIGRRMHDTEFLEIVGGVHYLRGRH